MFHLPVPEKIVRSAVLLLTVGAFSALAISLTAWAKTGSGVDGRQITPENICELERRVLLQGLVDVGALDPSIRVDIVFARMDNILGENVYGDFSRAYLRAEAAWKLVQASRILQCRHPELRLLVVDALRPRAVQHAMWKTVAGTPRQPYVANPLTGSMHNYGMAVDVTLFDTGSGEELDMGTPYHHFGPLAQPVLEEIHLQRGLLTPQQIENRLILRNAMVEAGWHVLSIEWWHFDAFPRDHVRRNFSIIE
jgi:zinc D-Ala-D-Ala dipeptidase